MAIETGTEKLGYDDILRTPEDGLRYEILDGALHVTPSARPRHQRVSKRLQRQLEAYFEEPGTAEVFDAPVDVLLGAHDVVVPDLVIVAEPGQVTDRAIEGSPLLLVEIVSPSTVRRDRTLKLERYAKHGVAHYWIVDPPKRTIECYRLKRRRYELAATGKGSDTVAHPDFPGLAVSLAPLWK
jgi:Uma2 family endonuclease